MEYLLGIDNGGTVTKAAIYNTRGEEVAVANRRTETLYPHPAHIERDMNDFWAANAQVIAESIRGAGINPADIAGVAAAGHGCGMYLVDGTGEPAWNGIISTDSRASAYVQKWYADGTFDRVFPRTCGSLWAAQPAALLPWFRDNAPEALQRTHAVLSCKDYIRYKLTGEAFAEITDCSGTGLVNQRSLAYDPELLDIFGISDLREKLPPIRQSADICGRVTKKAAAETGLLEGTPVAGGLFDITACSIASGITDPTKLCSIAGTWTINEYISPVPVQSPDLFMTSGYCMPGWWLITEGSPTSASNLEWFVSELMEAERRDTQAAGRSVFSACSDLVAGVPATDSDVAFLPFLYGTNAGPNASSCFIGMHGWHRKAHLLRAIFEGVAFSTRTHIDRLLAYRAKPAAVRVAGGAVKSSVWVQMFADVLQMPMEITATEELGALGAAICAGVGAGAFPSFPDAVSRMVKVVKVVEPDPVLQQVYEKKFCRYQTYIAALRKVWDGNIE